MITSYVAVKRQPFLLILLAFFAVGACATSGQVIFESSIEERIAALRLGQSTKSDVEKILGLDRSTDGNLWAYNFSDSAFDISERRQGPGLGIIPVSAGVTPTNTRAVVTVAFDDAEIMKRLEVARFFSEPYVNDYWYRIKDTAKEPLHAIAKIGEAAGMKVLGLDNEAGNFTLEDRSTKAKITVKLDGTTLRLTSRNPHHRLGPEYRAYTKREHALTNRISSSDIVQ
jgi:hypothetical protein